MSKTKILIILVFFALIIFANFLFLKKLQNNQAVLLTKKNQEIEQTKKDAFKAGIESARERLKTSGYYTENTVFNSVSGEIVSILNNKITVKIKPLELLADINLDTRIIKVNPNTKIYQLVVVSNGQEILDKNIGTSTLPDIFNATAVAVATSSDEKAKIYGDGATVYKNQDVSFNALKVGQIVFVGSDNDQNIKDLKEFKAGSITIQAEVSK